MRLISRDDGTWEMQRIGEMEFLMLGKLGDAANPGDSAEAWGRLFQSPLGRSAVDEAEDEIVGDWESLIHPDLETQFKTSLDVVAADMRETKGRKRNGEMEYRLIVPKKHADDWCSALNQARLVLHERFNFPEDEDAFEAEEGQGHEQWLAMVQSEVYGQIMEFLVLRVLWLK